MDPIFQDLIKLGPGGTALFFISTAVASIIFYITSSQYKKLKDQAHSEAIILKDQTITDWRTRCAELEAERNRYRDQSHLNAQSAQALELKVTELKQQPNVDNLASILREFKNDMKAFHEQQMSVNKKICETLSALTNK